MQIKTKLITSNSYNPYENLALEEYLFDNVRDEEIILYLWQNQNTIVIGKNQNPWKECQMALAEQDGIFIARRLSGGGAVFHDLGNLNFTFIMKEVLYDLDKQLQTILNGVKSLGINAMFSGKNDLVVDYRKFSGNAFYFDDGKAYHHGTILVNSNMTFLNKYLRVSKEKIASKGIDSVTSRVVNLADINDKLTIHEVAQALINSFEDQYGNCVETMEYPKIEKLQDLRSKYASWEWRLGQTPKFDIQFTSHFDFGSIELLFSLKNGIIKEVFIYSDAVITDILDQIKKALVGKVFNIREVNKALFNIPNQTLKEQDMIYQIQKWLETKGF